MDHQWHASRTRNGGIDRKYSSFDSAPSVPAKDPLILDFKEALGLAPSIKAPSTTTSPPASVASGDHLDIHPAPWPVAPVYRSTASPSMAQAHKAQNQCLKVCNTAASSGNRIAERMTEYSTMVKHLPHGFPVLANGLLDNCQVLSFIEFSLGEMERNGKTLTIDALSPLEKRIRASMAVFRLVDQMIGKAIEQERKHGMSRWFGKKFEDMGADRLGVVLSKTQEELRSSAFVFQRELGLDDMGSEAGIGTTELAAILESSNLRTKPVVPSAPKLTSAQLLDQAIEQQQVKENERLQEDARAMAAQSPSPVPVLSPISTITTSSRNDSHYPMRNESLRVDSGHVSNGSDIVKSPMTQYTASSFSSSVGPFQHERDPHYHSPSHSQFSQKTTMQQQLAIREDSRVFSPEIEDLCGDLANLDLDSNKVARIEKEPFMMPRRRARSSVDADNFNARNALIATIGGRDRQRVANFLDRGVSPNVQNGIHPINESIAVEDLETLRILLMYGGDPNQPDSEGRAPLAAAANKDSLHSVLALLKYGADPNKCPDPYTNSPLASAAIAGDLKLAHLLMMYGGHADNLTVDGDTLLIASINKKAPVTLIDLLLSYGADPNEKNREGKTALFEAITNGRVDIVKVLIEHGADPNLPGPKHMLWPSQYQPACLQVLLDNGAKFNKTPGIMELAASLNNIESVRILLKAGVDPNLKKDGVYTPLCTSIRDNRSELFKLLLANGADPNVPASEYPCFKCVTHHREGYLPALVAAGGNLRSPKGILETAVTSNNPNALKWLMDQGLDPNEKSPNGYTPLTSAIRDGQTAMVETLLNRGANPNVRGQDWPVAMAVRNPEILKLVLSRLREPRAFKGIVEMAVAANQIDSVRLLLEAGVSVEDRNGGVFSPLTSALRDRRREIVEFLINEAGADVNAPGEHLPIVKALRRCAEEPHTVMIDMLLEKGADPNKVYRGWNGIMQALENGDAAILKKLVDAAGVDLDARDELGRTVVEVAVSREWKEAVNILKGRA